MIESSKIEVLHEMITSTSWFKLHRDEIKAIREFYREKGMRCTAFVIEPGMCNIMAKIHLEDNPDRMIVHQMDIMRWIIARFRETFKKDMIAEATARAKSRGITLTYREVKK